MIIMILKPTSECQSKLIGQGLGMAGRFTIGIQASSPISEVITAPNMNFQFELEIIS